MMCGACGLVGGESVDSSLDVSVPRQTSTSTTIVVELSPEPSCSAYRGTGDLEGVELASYCYAALQLVEVVDRCQENGNRPDECLVWATASESDGGAGFTGYSEAELDLMFRLGQHHRRRLDAWEAEYDACVSTLGRDVCRSAIRQEGPNPYP
jgi:hypothetical protein